MSLRSLEYQRNSRTTSTSPFRHAASVAPSVLPIHFELDHGNVGMDSYQNLHAAAGAGLTYPSLEMGYMAARWYRPFAKAFRAGCYLLAHAAVAVLIGGLVSLVQTFLAWDGDPKLYDLIPVRYIFDTVDVAVMAVFLVCGTIEAIQVFRETDDD